MVFLSLSFLTRARGPDEFWRKRKIFKLAAHFYGRRRNCYSIAIRSVHRALTYSTVGRQLKKEDMKELREQRLGAATSEHGINFTILREGLSRCNILLNRKSLADLAIWEPRSFKAITDIACTRAKQDHFKTKLNIQTPNNVFVRGLIK
ncbi:PREDICTED: 39S ribosomal protein L20, mitochondrial [Trachymyrmex cornetzi]|uniref:39S ribosomal protein L20, mitochondrial n=1 Tax=Trachymyrmex cornetzi TaxID=471704 RepID=A0A195DCE5_9HYME|nr:PREDICTED: 39S ribosomal protein L20, mitochondrial [Trachymyrmex cornetzi]KYN10561.1 39S ribosomal protein L20, mitochondrial [Trachymyrmex cornetzi]